MKHDLWLQARKSKEQDERITQILALILWKNKENDLHLSNLQIISLKTLVCTADNREWSDASSKHEQFIKQDCIHVDEPTNRVVS